MDTDIGYTLIPWPCWCADGLTKRRTLSLDAHRPRSMRKFSLGAHRPRTTWFSLCQIGVAGMVPQLAWCLVDGTVSVSSRWPESCGADGRWPWCWTGFVGPSRAARHTRSVSVACHVRAIGRLPVAGDPPQTQASILRRYEMMFGRVTYLISVVVVSRPLDRCTR